MGTFCLSSKALRLRSLTWFMNSILLRFFSCLAWCFSLSACRLRSLACISSISPCASCSSLRSAFTFSLLRLAGRAGKLSAMEEVVDSTFLLGWWWRRGFL